MIKAYINKVENFLPALKESNTDLLRTAGLPENKITRMIKKIGIKSRRIAEKNIFSNDLAIKSAKKILKYINKNEIDYLIFCSNTPEYSLPTNACIIQDRLKLKTNIGAFDIILACSGYIYSLSVAKSLILSNQMDRNDALKKLKEPLYDNLELINDKDYIANKLNINSDYLDQIIDSKPVNHEVYKNWNFYYKILQFLKPFVSIISKKLIKKYF